MSTAAETTASPTASDEPRPSPGRVEMVLDQIEQLPTLPAVATHLLTMTTRADTSAREVVEVLESDPSLTAKILSIARRVDTGIPTEAATIDKAVVLMGFDTIRNIALSIKVFEAFGPNAGDDDQAFDRTEFWKHSLAVACAAQLLSGEMPDRVDAEEAFVCGLVHDIGKVALDACLPKSFGRVARLASNDRRSMADVERQILGMDHTVAGRRLAQRWRLPEKLVNCIWLHHHCPDELPPSVPDRPYIQVIHLADLIAREQRIGYSGNFAFPERAVRVAESLGLDVRSLDRVVAQLADRIEMRAGIVGLERLTSERLYLGALSAANAELGQLNTALVRSNQQLGVRARFFDALRRFGEATCRNAQVRDVCAAAAEAVSFAAGTSETVVFFRAAQDRVWYAGRKTGDAEPTSEMLLVGEADDNGDASHVPMTVPRTALLPAEPYARPVLRAFAGRLGEPPFWLLPLTVGEGGFGGAVFAATRHQADRLAHAADEVRTLVTALGLALTNATARADADRLNEELVAINQRMHEAEAARVDARSLSMIAEMAAGAAHELNNPLTVISGRAQLLRTQLEHPEAEATLRQIEEQARRCSGIVSDLMAFACPEPPKPTPVDLSALLEEIRTAFLKEHGLESAQILVRVAPNAQRSWVDPGHARTIIGELLANAHQAGNSKQTRVVINCRAELTDDTIVVEVSDEGRGMTPDVLQRAFDPFFSHRPAGRGKGLGLSRARRLAEVNGGRLWLESANAVGTTACLKLPVQADVGTRDSA